MIFGVISVFVRGSSGTGECFWEPQRACNREPSMSAESHEKTSCEPCGSCALCEEPSGSMYHDGAIATRLELAYCRS